VCMCVLTNVEGFLQMCLRVRICMRSMGWCLNVHVGYASAYLRWLHFERTRVPLY